MRNVLKVIASIFLVFIIAYGIFYLRTILAYILISSIVALLGRPIMSAIRKVKIHKFQVPNAIAAMLTLLCFYLIIFGFVGVFMPLVIQEAQMIMNVDFQAVIDSLSKPLGVLDEKLNYYQLNETGKSTKDIIKDNITSFMSMANLSNVFSGFVGVLGVALINIITALFSITFITFFFLTDEKLFYNFALNFVPKKFEKSFNQVLFTSKTLLTRYFIGLLIQMTLVATFVTIGMAMLGLDNALLIGFFAGIINIIPYIGPIIGMLFGLFVSVTTSIDQDFYVQILPLITKITSVFFVVQLLDNIFFQPFIFSNSIKAHPLEIFLLVWAAATFVGVSGMIFAIPCYTIVRVIAKELWTVFNIDLKEVRKIEL